jgi:hypothetical protein
MESQPEVSIHVLNLGFYISAEKQIFKAMIYEPHLPTEFHS